MNNPIWSPEHEQQLTALREAAGIDVTLLARRHSLSVHQVEQLEQGGNDRFYSPAIKLQVGRKLIKSLGGEWIDPLPFVVGEGAGPHSAPAVSASDDVTVIGPIRPVSWSVPRPSTAGRPGRMRWSWLSAPVLLGVAAVGYTLWPETSAPSSAVSKAPHTASKVPATAVQAPPILSAPAAPAAPAAATPSSPSDSGAPEPSAGANSVAPAAEVVAPEPPAPVEPQAALAAPTVSAAAANCVFPPNPPRGTVFQPRLEGTYVYVEVTTPASVCVRDARQRVTALDLAAGRGRTVRGSAPFELASASLDDMRVFFQGKLVAPQLLAKGHVVLNALPVFEAPDDE